MDRREDRKAANTIWRQPSLGSSDNWGNRDPVSLNPLFLGHARHGRLRIADSTRGPPVLPQSLAATHSHPRIPGKAVPVASLLPRLVIGFLEVAPVFKARHKHS